jgi:hypothetical protein
LGLEEAMTKNEKMEQGRRWLALVRGSGDEGDAGSKALYLRKKGYTEQEVEELLQEEGGGVKTGSAPCTG